MHFGREVGRRNCVKSVYIQGFSVNGMWLNMADKKRFMQNEDPIEKNQYSVAWNEAGILAGKMMGKAPRSNKDAEEGKSRRQAYFL